MKHVPRKRFGQNFLIDQKVIADIVSAIRPQNGERLLEIGPGLGALTAPLLARVDALHVVEIDRDIVARLRRQFPPERLIIHQGDALAFDFASLGADLRIVGNLPYNISTPLLFHLADHAASVRDMHFMLQKEVVERMVAPAGDGARGRLSVMLQQRFAIEWLFDVPPDAFDPAPKVDSAIVRLIPLPPASDAGPGLDRALFASVVSAAFSQRRKMLRNNLQALCTPADWEKLPISPTRRAEELSVQDFVAICACLAAKAGQRAAE